MNRRHHRSSRERLHDVLTSIRAIYEHRRRGKLTDPLVFDAIRVRLIEIGEAVNALPEDVLGAEADIPWKEVVGMRHKLGHHYFDTALGIVTGTVEDDLPVLEAAVRRMLSRLD